MKRYDENIAVDEALLIENAKNGDERAFEALAEKYKRVVEYHIKSINADSSTQDDLFQEGLIGLLKAVRSYDGKTSLFVTYASHCVRNSIVSAIRKNSKQVLNGETSFDTEKETVPSAEDVLLNDVGAQILYEKVFSALSPYEKTVFELYLSDMSYENIAFVTGKSVKSTSNAVFRIRNKLRGILI